LLSLLGDAFGTAEAIEAGKQMKVSKQSVMNYLKELMKNRLVRKIRQRQYAKKLYPQIYPSDENCNENVPVAVCILCSFAEMYTVWKQPKLQKVQGARCNCKQIPEIRYDYL